jgi:hypothetical protein
MLRVLCSAGCALMIIGAIGYAAVASLYGWRRSRADVGTGG